MLIAATGDRIPAGRAPGRPRTRRPAGDRGGALWQGPPVPGATGPTHRCFYGGGISRAAGTGARAASRMDVLGGGCRFLWGNSPGLLRYAGAKKRVVGALRGFFATAKFCFPRAPRHAGVRGEPHGPLLTMRRARLLWFIMESLKIMRRCANSS